jgi:hypothetical protein
LVAKPLLLYLNGKLIYQLQLMSDVRFRQVNDYASVHGFVGGYPNFHQADYGCGTVFGTFLIRPGQGEWRDVPASALGHPPEGDWGARFRATNDYAFHNGFVGAFPTFTKPTTAKESSTARYSSDPGG